VTHGEFGGVAGNFLVDGAVVVGDVDFGEKSAGGAECTVLVQEKATKEGLFGELQFEGEEEHRLDHGPDGIFSGGAADVRVVSTDGDSGGARKKVVARGEDGEIVVSVVVVGSGLAGESHAGEGSELAADVGLEVKVVVNQKGGDRKSLHFLDFKDDGFTALGLVESRVVIAGVGHVGLAERPGPFSKLGGSVTSVDEDVVVGFAIAHDALVFLDGTEEENDGVVGEGQGLAGLPAGEKGVLVDFVLGF